MKQGIYNFNDIVQGNTMLAVKFYIKQDGLPIDLTNTDIIMKIKRNEFCEETYELSTLNDKITPGTSFGRFEVKKQIIDFEPVNYYYDIELYDIVNGSRTYIKGRWKILNKI